jgi:hypothetical protein
VLNSLPSVQLKQACDFKPNSKKHMHHWYKYLYGKIFGLPLIFTPSVSASGCFRRSRSISPAWSGLVGYFSGVAVCSAPAESSKQRRYFTGQKIGVQRELQSQACPMNQPTGRACRFSRCARAAQRIPKLRTASKEPAGASGHIPAVWELLFSRLKTIF